MTSPVPIQAAELPVRPARPSVEQTAGIAESEWFAGYVAKLSERKEISGRFTVPNLACDGAPDSGIMSIIELASRGGEEYADGAVFSYCQDGLPFHEPAFDASSGQVAIPHEVRDGDVILVTSRFTARREIRITMDNLTRDWSATATFPDIPAREAASLQYRFSLDGGDPVPPYDYRSLPVKNVMIGGKPLARVEPRRVDLVIGDEVVISPGKIVDKTDFRFRYVG